MKPKQLFLIDSLGGFLSAFFLWVVLARFEQYVGMSPRILSYLAVVATLYGLFSMGCYLFLKQQEKRFLKIIGIANLLYCSLTALCVMMNYDKLTILGLTYFVIEIVVISLLASFELRISNTIKIK